MLMVDASVYKMFWTNALRWRDPFSPRRRPLSVLFSSAAVQIWLGLHRWKKKKREAERKNTQCQPVLHYCTTCTIYIQYAHRLAHTQKFTHCLTHLRPTTPSLTHTEDSQRKAPLRKWFTLKVLAWPITSVMFNNRINACGHSSDSLSGGAKCTTSYTPFLHLLYCLKLWKGNATFSAFECFQTALRQVMSSAIK